MKTIVALFAISMLALGANAQDITLKSTKNMYTEMTEKEKRSEISIAKYQFKHPSVHQCARCEIPQFECEYKTFPVGNRWGTWVLCQYCWDQSSLEERMAFYKAWYYKMEYWFSSNGRGDSFNVTMNEIITAVNKESNQP